MSGCFSLFYSNSDCSGRSAEQDFMNIRSKTVGRDSNARQSLIQPSVIQYCLDNIRFAIVVGSLNTS